MARTSTLKKLINHFGADQKGTLAVMTGIAAVPLLLGAGAAIDFVRYNSAQTQVQAALDAGALAAAAGRSVSDVDRIAAAQATFDRNIQHGLAAKMEVSSEFKVVDDRIVSSAEIKMPTAFMSLAGISSMNGVSSAEVGIQSDKKAEVVLVLDYSWSMTETAGSEVKYIAMKKAATDLVNDLSKSDPDKVKFGLVPFSHQVYTSLPAAYVVGGGTGTWTGCTLDRKYPFNVSDSTPTSASGSKWNPSIVPVVGPSGCGNYVSHHLKTVDLSNNFNAVTSQLAAMTPYSYTNIALGVEFGYHMLSPNAPFTSAAAYDDDETKKFMVVLTDGNQTEANFGPGGSRSVANGENNLEKLCTSAKANGITMITMALDLNHGATRDRLRNCATDPDKNFFAADTSDDLSSAFETIKSAITAEVYLSK